MSKDREYWHIPKRSDLHQAIVFIHGVYEKYHGKSWNASSQDRIGSYLARKGSTNNGRNITPQSIRTLLAAIPQYFGFIIINEDTTPHKIEVTDAGKKIIEETRQYLEEISYSNLREGKKLGALISYSAFFELQFKKLQLSNPNVTSYCSNISVSPIYCIVKLLEQLSYLDKEEIAMYVFKIKDHSEINLKLLEIQNFRKLSSEDRHSLVYQFEQTENGQKALVKAPTTTYFLTLCSYLPFFNIKKGEISLSNSADIDEVLLIYKQLNTFNYEDDRFLWNDFYTNTSVVSSPFKITVKNKYYSDVFVIIYRDKKVVLQKMISTQFNDNKLEINILFGIENRIEVYSCDSSDLLLAEVIQDRKEELIIENDPNSNHLSQNKINYYDLINAHINSKTFDDEFIKRLQLINAKTGKDYILDKNLRGGRLEELFYQLLKSKFNEGILKEEPIWNGQYDALGLPRPAPGGKGYGDIVLFVDELQIIFELTTIHSKSAQEKSEAFSVPDHINNHAIDNPNKKTIGIYLAPLIHKRVSEGMKTNKIIANGELFSFEISTFLELFKNNEGSVKEFLLNLEKFELQQQLN